MKSSAVSLLLTLALSVPQFAVALDDVPSGYRQVAAEYAIPPRIFYAVALTESGKAVAGTHTLRPWPWTLNIRGTPHFFVRRRAAEQALQRALAAGERLIDVGLMQVNWRYHEPRLRSPMLALDPYRNLRIAARILNDCQRERRDWWAAVGCYHAPGNAPLAARYQARVRHHWRHLAHPS